MRSWKTTAAGFAASLGLAAQNLEGPAWLKTAGLLVSLVALAILGGVARDDAAGGNVTLTPTVLPIPLPPPPPPPPPPRAAEGSDPPTTRERAL